MRIGVNGRFLAAVPTGVQRFALELARRVMARADALLLVPWGVDVPSAVAPPERVRTGRLRGHAWEQVELPTLARDAGCAATLHLANALPLAGGPHAVVVHDTAVFEHPEWFGVRYQVWHRRVLLPAARRAGAVGTTSRAAAAALAPLLGRRPEDVVVVPQGVAPLDRPATPEAVGDVRRRWDLAGPYLLALGAGDPRKNVAFLERLVARWGEEEGTPAPDLVVVGGPTGRVFAGSPRASEAGGRSAARVVRAGRVDDETLRALYTGAAAFCFPSLLEGFGRPPLEAMACGAPVVTAPYGPVREVLGDAALVVPLDADAWLGALRRLLRDGPSPELGVRALAVVAAHSWEDGAAATLELCARAAGAARRRSPAGGEEGVASAFAGTGRAGGEEGSG